MTLTSNAPIRTRVRTIDVVGPDVGTAAALFAAAFLHERLPLSRLTVLERRSS